MIYAQIAGGLKLRLPMSADLDLFAAVEPKTCGNCGAVRVQL